MKPAGSRGAPAAEGGAGGGGGGGQAAGLAPIAANAAAAAANRASCPAWEQVVHSRSQVLFCSGTKALGDALKLLVPRSTAFMSSDAELWDFLCSLKHEFSPVILRSKDVYGYASCRAVVPDLPRAWAPKEEARAGGSGGGRRRSSRRGGGGGGGGGTAPAAAASKGKRPTPDARSGRGGGGGGGAKRAAKKRRVDGQTPDLPPPPELRACERRREPARRSPLQSPAPLPIAGEKPPPPPAAAFLRVKVSGDIWKRRNLEAALRRGQRLLRVNLAPVVRLRRIPGSTSCC